MKKTVIIEIIVFLFIFLFLYAATSKLWDVDKFRVQIGQSPLLTSIAPFIAWFIPSLEILLCAMLAIPRFRLLAFYGCFILMLMFSFYIIAVLNFSDHVPCSCGGVLQKLGWKEHLVFNFFFVGLSVVGILFLSKKGDEIIERKIVA
jgi:uncharacterized membrane protein YphA (DoxX/SURF4 family)